MSFFSWVDKLEVASKKAILPVNILSGAIEKSSLYIVWKIFDYVTVEYVWQTISVISASGL